MVAVVPGFTYRQIPTNYEVEHWDWSLGLILHVATYPADEMSYDVGANASQFGWFSNPAAQASSHWWVGAKGTAEQYLDPDEHISYAQSGGNSSYHSVETGGNPNEPLTEAQCQAVARIYRWGHDEFGWPYQLANYPGEKGLGYHGMGGFAWGGHIGCPGGLRIAQRQHILDLAVGRPTITIASQGDDMPLSAADLEAIRAAVWKTPLVDATLNPHGFDGQTIALGTNLAAWGASKKLDQGTDVDALAKAITDKLNGKIVADVDEQALAHDLIGTIVSAITHR